MVHPKSDGQRQRLSESVKNILLFRALDEVSYSNTVRAQSRQEYNRLHSRALTLEIPMNSCDAT